MDLFQIAALILLCVFYITYIIKALMLKSHGITVNLLGKGEKPKKALIVENLLRTATGVGAAVQFTIQDRLSGHIR